LYLLAARWSTNAAPFTCNEKPMTDELTHPDLPMIPFLDCQRIVLCRPSHPGNIGAAARAMKTMGLGYSSQGAQLLLVNPLCAVDEVAIRRASGAADLVTGCRVVDSLAEALTGCTGAFGMTVRARELGPEPLQPKAAVAAAHAYWQQGGAQGALSAFVFGNETNGLTNEELQHCRAEVSIATNPAYGSLNLGAAVQIMTYLLKEVSGNTASVDTGATRYASPLATVDAVEGFYGHLEAVLIEAGFHDPQKPRRLMPKIRRIFERTRLEADEVNILRGIISALKAPQKVD
jgi:tRNA/rRNA methyltransferase